MAVRLVHMLVLSRTEGVFDLAFIGYLPPFEHCVIELMDEVRKRLNGVHGEDSDVELEGEGIGPGR